MVDDWTWFFTSEGGRDRILRGEIEGLQSASSAAHRQSSRVSSQLAHLQGSIESRLTALSAAFDAYVELGDVREQLAAYPDTRAARRDVVEAIEAMAAGARPEPLDTADSDYWLPYATNAVIALHRGDDPTPDRDRALALARESDLYVTAAAGALDRADSVADRVPDLLVGDGTLTVAQEVIWSAVLAGTYGDVWAQLDQRWGPALADRTSQSEDASWTGRLETASGSSEPVDQLRWLRGLLAGGHVAEVDKAVVQGGLRGVVTELVAQGVGDEAALLRRSRELRERIENPTRPAETPGTAPPEPAGEERGRTVTAAVVHAFLSGQGTPLARTWLTRWVASGLLPEVDRLEQVVTTQPPATTTARTPGGDVIVSASGPDQARMPVVIESIETFGRVSPVRMKVLTALTGAIAALALVVGLVSGSAWAIALVVLAAGTGVAAALAWRDHRSGAARLQEDLGRARRAVDDAQVRASREEDTRRLAMEETRQLAAALRATLTQDRGPVPGERP